MIGSPVSLALSGGREADEAPNEAEIKPVVEHVPRLDRE